MKVNDERKGVNGDKMNAHQRQSERISVSGL